MVCIVASIHSIQFSDLCNNSTIPGRVNVRAHMNHPVLMGLSAFKGLFVLSYYYLPAPVAARLRERVRVRAEVDKGDRIGPR